MTDSPTGIAEALRRALPGAWRPPGARGPHPEEDICQHPLGAPLAWIAPRDTDEVQRIVTLARQLGARVAVTGARTAYWRPVSLEGAVALDTRELCGIGPLEDGVIEVEAGATVGAVQAALAAEGATLPAHPDAYGDSTIGAMAATAFASGVGSGRATVDRLVAGLDVVLGTGERVVTGTSRALGLAAFARLGLPDPTGLFLGAQGSLGVITRLALRAEPARPRAALSWRARGASANLAAAVALASGLRAPGTYETLRVEARAEAHARSAGEPRFQGTMIVDSPFGEEELAARLALLRARVTETYGDALVSLSVEPEPARWWGPPDAHWRDLRDGVFRGVDAIVGYPSAPAAIEVAGAIYDAARAREGLRSLRVALYFSPESVNLGLHAQLDDVARGDAFETDGIARLATLDAVPYRWSDAWARAVGDRLHGPTSAWLARLAERCDPDGVLSPREPG